MNSNGRMTARDIIISALRTSGAIGATEIPSGEELKQGLNELHNLIEVWNNDDLWPYSLQTIEAFITESKDAYTIGPDEDISYKQIPEIIDTLLLDTSTGWKRIKQIALSEWRKNGVLPQGELCFVYNGNTIIFNKPLDELTSIKINIQGKLMSYDLNDPIILPNGYWIALQYGLASNLALLYGILETIDWLDRKATDYKAAIKLVNYKPGSSRRNVYSYNIVTDEGV